MDRKEYAKVADFQGCAVKDFMYLRDWKRESPMADLTPVIPRFNEQKCTPCSICETVCPYGASAETRSGQRAHGDARAVLWLRWCVATAEERHRRRSRRDRRDGVERLRHNQRLGEVRCAR